MRESWRWFGQDDPVGLEDIRQTGATDIVCALYDEPIGEVWPLKKLLELKRKIESATSDQTPLRWRVVESIPVHEDIKLGCEERDRFIDNWITTLGNLASCGIDVVCYNFMPVIDWTRTDLQYRLPSGGLTLRFDHRSYAVFDLHILERPNASENYTPSEVERAARDFEIMSDERARILTRNIIAGLPGRMTDSYDLGRFRRALQQYDGIERVDLEENLDYFLERVLPTAESLGIKLAIHPDDPPRSLFGLPRVVCNAEDVKRILGRHRSRANGIAMCAGTFGSHVDNDVSDMVKRFCDRIYFAHLRSIKRDVSEPRSFIEAEHLAGDVDLVDIVATIVRFEQDQASTVQADAEIFFRPDHGHQLMDDLNKSVNPGYSAIGRLKGLAEIRGVIRAFQSISDKH